MVGGNTVQERLKQHMEEQSWVGHMAAPPSMTGRKHLGLQDQRHSSRAESEELRNTSNTT